MDRRILLTGAVPIAGLKQGLTHAYTFEEASGSLIDRVGTSNFTNTNVSFQNAGKINFAYLYASNAFSTSSNNLGIGYGSTIKVWFKISDLATTRYVFWGSTSTTVYGATLGVSSGSTVVFILGEGTGTNSLFYKSFTTSQSFPVLNTWVYALVRIINFNTVELNINGVWYPTTTAGSGLSTNFSQPYTLARRATIADGAKYIDEFYIWNRLLTDSEVDLNYSIESSGQSILN